MWTHLFPARMQKLKKFSILFSYISALEEQKFHLQSLNNWNLICVWWNLWFVIKLRERKVICNQQTISPFAVPLVQLLSLIKRRRNKIFIIQLKSLCFVYVPSENIYKRICKRVSELWEKRIHEGPGVYTIFRLAMRYWEAEICE